MTKHYTRADKERARRHGEGCCLPLLVAMLVPVVALAAAVAVWVA